MPYVVDISETVPPDLASAECPSDMGGIERFQNQHLVAPLQYPVR
jgi:hypothetical protein